MKKTLSLLLLLILFISILASLSFESVKDFKVSKSKYEYAVLPPVKLPPPPK